MHVVMACRLGPRYTLSSVHVLNFERAILNVVRCEIWPCTLSCVYDDEIMKGDEHYMN